MSGHYITCCKLYNCTSIPNAFVHVLWLDMQTTPLFVFCHFFIFLDFIPILAKPLSAVSFIRLIFSRTFQIHWRTLRFRLRFTHSLIYSAVETLLATKVGTRMNVETNVGCLSACLPGCLSAWLCCFSVWSRGSLCCVRWGFWVLFLVFWDKLCCSAVGLLLLLSLWLFVFRQNDNSKQMDGRIDGCQVLNQNRRWLKGGNTFFEAPWENWKDSKIVCIYQLKTRVFWEVF